MDPPYRITAETARKVVIMARTFDVDQFERLNRGADQILTNPSPVPRAGDANSRNPVDVEANSKPLKPFANGDSNLVVMPDGQAIAAESPEFQAFKRQYPDSADKFQQLSHMMRTFYSSDYPLFRERFRKGSNPPGKDGKNETRP